MGFFPVCPRVTNEQKEEKKEGKEERKITMVIYPASSSKAPFNSQ